MATSQGFFEETTEQSQVKAAIVSKYFGAWARVMIAVQKRYPHRSGGKIAYIDLFAGPGRYKDGSSSTPLLVLEKAIGNPELQCRLVGVFNDKDEDNSRSLQQAIDALPGVGCLAHKPQVTRLIVGEDIARLFEQMHLVPTLFFVDPWGYKGLSLRLVNSVLKDWGCDCIFFFNYNRINMGLGNPLVKEHMDALFGQPRGDELRRRLARMDPEQRELTIVEELTQALKDMGRRYVLPFRFKRDRTTRTSHHLVFVSKNFKGYEIMKDVMAAESSATEQGVPTFEYSPADARQPLLFELSRPLDALGRMLLTAFAGQTLTMEQVYRAHSVGRPFIKRNYKDALLRLEASGRLRADPPAERRRHGTFGDHVTVHFAAGGT